MSIKQSMTFLVLSGLLTFSAGFAEENDRCEENNSNSQGNCECKCNNGTKPCGYNPMCRYYPYRTIYQHSCVREEYGDDPVASWPGRRDGELSDELTR
jgi:hypothetical protein